MTEERLKSLTKTYPKYYIHIYRYIYMVGQIGKGK